MAGKGSRRRPNCISSAENILRWALFEGKLTNKEFDKQYEELKKQGKIIRNGRIINE